MTEPEQNPKPKFRPLRTALISLALCLIIPGTRDGAIAVLKFAGWSIVTIALLALLLVFMINPRR
ncbi:hypothetical protein [Micromonospora sp. NPDC005161]